MKTAIYLAARYGRRLELLGYAGELEARGYRIVSSWIAGKQETRPNIDGDATDEERAVWAMEDLNDLTQADWLVFFGEQPGGGTRGGRMVEFGWFLAMRHFRGRLGARPGPCAIVVGPRETVFHCLPDVLAFPTWQEFMAWEDAR